MMLAQAVDGSVSPLGELGAGLGGSTLAVLAVLVLTLVLLRLAYGQRRGRASAGGKLLNVTAQVELSPTQSIYLVRAAGRCLLVGGTSDNLALLAELDPAQVDALQAAAPVTDPAPWTERLRAFARAR